MIRPLLSKSVSPKLLMLSSITQDSSFKELSGLTKLKTKNVPLKNKSNQPLSVPKSSKDNSWSLSLFFFVRSTKTSQNARLASQPIVLPIHLIEDVLHQAFVTDLKTLLTQNALIRRLIVNSRITLRDLNVSDNLFVLMPLIRTLMLVKSTIHVLRTLPCV